MPDNDQTLMGVQSQQLAATASTLTKAITEQQLADDDIPHFVEALLAVHEAQQRLLME